MRRAGVLTLILGMATVATVWAQGLASTDARAFFDRYVALESSYDASLADLYADDARITSTRRFRNGSSRTLEMTGRQWKSLIVAALPVARAQGDRSDYTNVRVETLGERIRIRADRYAVRKCYWDRGYSMVIARHGDGDIKILEEDAEMQPDAAC